MFLKNSECELENSERLHLLLLVIKYLIAQKELNHISEFCCINFYVLRFTFYVRQEIILSIQFLYKHLRITSILYSTIF